MVYIYREFIFVVKYEDVNVHRQGQKITSHGYLLSTPSGPLKIISMKFWPYPPESHGMMRLFGAYNMEEVEFSTPDNKEALFQEQVAHGISDLAYHVLTLISGPPLKLMNCVLERGFLMRLLSHDDYESYLQMVHEHKLKVQDRRLVY
jgi:hypothetical protein